MKLCLFCPQWWAIVFIEGFVFVNRKQYTVCVALRDAISKYVYGKGKRFDMKGVGFGEKRPLPNVEKILRN